MTKLTFSFDAGTNSLGSAVIDKEAGKILHSGVSIFPMGVNLEKGTKEESRNLIRRLKRQGRRQNFRSRMRKEKLAQLLIAKRMFPDVDTLYQKYFEGDGQSFRDRWEKVIRMTPLPEELQDYFHKDPYQIRHRAFKEERLSLHEIGRALYHFAQRRGYKETLQDDSEEKGKIYQGDPESGKTGIDETKELVAQFGTLGNGLYHQDPHDKRHRNRYTLRSMYTNEFDTVFRGQQPYHPEVLTEELYQKLGGIHPSDTQQNGVLFYQRPLRSMKHLIGKCSLESGKPKAPASTLEFERFRAWQTINQIKFEGHELEEDEKRLLLDYILSAKKKLKFEQLAKKLKKPVERFNYEPKDSIAASPVHANFQSIFKKKWDQFSDKEREDLWHLKYWAEDPEWLEKQLEGKYGLSEEEIKAFKGFKMTKDYANLSRKAIKNILLFMEKGYRYDEAVLLAGVRNALKPEWFDELELYEQNEMEDRVLKAARRKEKGSTSIDRVRAYLSKEHEVDEKHLDKLYHHSMKEEGDGSMKYLPAPEELKNPIVMQALYQLRKVYNALVDEFGEPEEVRIELARELKTNKENRAKIRKRQQELEVENDEIKERLDKEGVPHSPANIQKLKLMKEIERIAGRFANPFRPDENFGITKSFFSEGAVQVEHIIPYSISMNDSLANKTLCDADTNRLKGNKTPYQYFKEHRPDEWEEIKQRIFKILPYQKAKRFVSEQNPDADDFISRQLNDTRYISRQAVAYLKKTCKKVEITEGSVVSMLRYYWGLDGVLTPSLTLEAPDGEYLAALDERDDIISHTVYHPQTKKKDTVALAKLGEVVHGQVKDGRFYLIKQRDDHRHHALDAIVVAFANRSYLQKVSTLLGEGLERKEIKYSRDHQLEKPWDRFYTDVRKAIENVLVHHQHNDRVVSKVKKRLYNHEGEVKRKPNGEEMFAEGLAARGQLHEESVFGMHAGENGELYFHKRDSLNSIKGYKQWRSIVSPRVREAIYERVKELYPKEKLVNGKLPETWSISDLDKEDQNHVFFITDEEKNPIPQIFLGNKSGEPVPVKKARFREKIGRPVQVKESINQYVKPGSNHHCMAYISAGNELQFEFVTFWDAVERKKQGAPLFQLPAGGKEVKNIFLRNRIYVLEIGSDELDELIEKEQYSAIGNYLYRVEQMSPASYYVQFRKHTAARLDNKNDWRGFSSAKAYGLLNPQEVTVDVLGRIKRR
ncbi:MAG: hypothetical protein CMI35_17730 [Owenweeksia sp.]|nr:hypothetical protein [Owenweeksia sp.]|tara:strand:- start:4212 stop:7856 length:3645 start_codon:yes stop_codon:yes gene_type:complete